MTPLRTPLEVALGERLPLDMDDLDLGNLEAQDAADEAREARLLDEAIETGEFLYREAVRSANPRFRGGAR